MLCERAVNFGQWKTFSENYKPMRVWLWLVYKFTENYYPLTNFVRDHSNSKEVSYLSWQNTYHNLKTACHIKLKFFLWTKLLENLLFAKRLISATVSLSHIFPENFIKVPHVAHKIFRFSRSILIFSSIFWVFWHFLVNKEVVVTK